MRRTLAAVLVAAALGLSGCTDDIPEPGQAQIDVDTPQLRQLKADAGIEACASGTAEPVDGGLPDVTLPCLGGGEDVELASLRGPLVVNLWASWCGPCRTEMPAIAEFYDRYGDQVPVVGIDYIDPQTGPALELAAESGVTYPLLADPQGDLQAKPPFAARVGVPSFVFVDADGQATLDAGTGAIDDVDELVGLVEEHLGIKL
jgi:thiol-disulfide isomerase/thioredoxin